MRCQWKWTAAVVILMVAAIARGNEPPSESLQSAGKQSLPAVLIATRESEFKSELVKKIKEAFSNRAAMTVISMDKLNKTETADFAAIVVLGERKGWLMFSAKERRFLRRLQEKNKLVMVMTAADADWKWNRDDVDVVTGASKKDNLGSILAEVTKRIDEILSKSAP